VSTFSFTVAFTDNLFVLATSIWDDEQKTKSLCLVLLFAPRAAQDVQESENTSILQELHQVLITEKWVKDKNLYNESQIHSFIKQMIWCVYLLHLLAWSREENPDRFKLHSQERPKHVSGYALNKDYICLSSELTGSRRKGKTHNRALNFKCTSISVTIYENKYIRPVTLSKVKLH